MTGFGKSSKANSTIEITIEAKSVNHKYLDTSLKLPRSYNELEIDIRSEIGKKIQRGRVEVFVTRKVLTDDAVEVNFNQPLFETYYAACSNVLEHYEAFTEEVRTALIFELATNREFLNADEAVANVALEKKLLFSVLNEALSKLMTMRVAEGIRLRKDINGRVKMLRLCKKQVEGLAKTSPAKKAQKLRDRLKLLTPDILKDQIRLTQEAAIIADKIDVAEELVRVDSHLDQIEVSLKQYPQGRKLDFLIQELFREWNTIGSKTQDSKIQTSVVEAKVELERLREQIQNIE